MLGHVKPKGKYFSVSFLMFGLVIPRTAKPALLVYIFKLCLVQVFRVMTICL